MKKKIAIVGAGPAGLMAAEFLAQYDYEVHVYEQKPSAARKFLMAGKTGLNISHAEPEAQFIQRYDQAQWLAPWIQRYNANWIQQWMHGLGIESYVGSSGRIFPVEMKAAPLLRAWLKRLLAAKVIFHYRHKVIDLAQQQLTIQNLVTQEANSLHFDRIILACGAVSWSKLGSDGAWQKWLNAEQISPFQPSNVGVTYSWSPFMQAVFGQPLKRVAVWTTGQTATIGDVIITQYGFESGVIYKQNRALRQQIQPQLHFDLLPEQTIEQLLTKLSTHKKQSLNNVWRKAGLDQVKISLIREIVPKADWANPQRLAQHIKKLTVNLSGFRPIDEAISCAGGVKREALMPNLQLKTAPHVYLCGEMLDWDAPTGGYLLTACFATGRIAAEAVHQSLQQQ